MIKLRDVPIWEKQQSEHNLAELMKRADSITAEPAVNANPATRIGAYLTIRKGLGVVVAFVGYDPRSGEVIIERVG